MNDPFAELDAQLQRAEFKPKIAAFVKAFNAKDAETVGRMRREDPRMENVFDFMHYYDAAKATPQRTDTMKNIELRNPGIVRVYENARLKAMLVGKGRRRKTPSRRKNNGGRRRKTHRNP